MKKTLLLFALLLPLWTLAQTPNVDFNSTWVEYDVAYYGSYGMLFHFDVTVHNCTGKELLANVFIEDSNHNWMKSNDKAYATSVGTVFGYETIKAIYPSCRWNDLKVFIPYSAMSMPESGLSYQYALYIRELDFKEIKNSPFYTLDWAAHASLAKINNKKPAVKFYNSWVEYDVYSGGEKGVNFHFDYTVWNALGKDLWAVLFINDSNNVWMKTNNATYRSKPDIICNSQKITPIYDDSRWQDFKIFLPYSAMIVSEGVTYSYSLYIRYSDGKEIRNSKFYPMDLAGHYPSKQINTNCEKPTIDWLSEYSSTIASFEVKAGVKSKSEVTSTGISVNGSAYRGMKTVKNDGYQMRINETVTLQEGSNEIVLSATNSCGTTTKTYTVTYTKAYTEPVYAEKRVALVIGNSNYQSSPLANPVNDANDIAASLRSVGFDVKTVLNGSKRDMENAIADLRKRSDKNTVALFYYAGHGIQKDGCNYLVPVDANMQDAADVEYACTDVNRVLSNMEASGCTMNIIILDACRDNPFERSWSRGLGTRGLSTLNAPRGTFISYATAPGDVAQDGKGRNSPYADAFIKTLKTPGLGLYDFFQKVEIQVENSTGGTQIPWMSSSFRGQFYFNPKQ